MATRAMVLLPKCVTSRPEKGRAVHEPAGKANRILPNWASLRWSLIFMAGMRVAQEAKKKTGRKKKKKKAGRNPLRLINRKKNRVKKVGILCFFLNWWVCLFSQK